MNNRPHTDVTVAFYDLNAAAFSLDTKAVDMGNLYSEFLPRVRKSGRILDAGCGAGRDAAFFKHQGFSVVAFDASRELAAIASQVLGQPVRVMTFLDLDSIDEFDGIWVCASLLHVPTTEMDGVLRRLVHALKKGGAMYVSFKYGRTESERNGRFFNDYDECKLQAVLERHPALAAEKVWQTQDARLGRQEELWLNAILTKV